MNRIANALGNLLRGIVPDCRQALDVEVPPAIDFNQRDELARQCTTSDDEHISCTFAKLEAVLRRQCLHLDGGHLADLGRAGA